MADNKHDQEHVSSDDRGTGPGEGSSSATTAPQVPPMRGAREAGTDDTSETSTGPGQTGPRDTAGGVTTPGGKHPSESDR